MKLIAQAHADQTDAREREFDRKAQRAALAFFVLVAPLIAYSILAVLGVLPAAPWSPLGQ